LGSKWSGAVDIFKVLSVAAFIQPVVSTAGLVLLSLGQARKYLVLGTINSAIIVISFILGLPWGAIGVAVGYTIATYVTIAPTSWYCFRQSPVSIRDFFSAISRPVIASLCMGAAIFLSYLFLANQPDIVVVAVCFVIGLLVYPLVLVLIPGGVRMLREFLSVGLLVLRKDDGVLRE
jgi:PST family polysaccharide transporter